jgi:CheY-like chemotaxis protein
MSGPSKRVLVVDDDIDSAELLAELLRAKGLNVSIAYNALAALDLVSTFSPEVVLLEIGLPEMTGYELARRICQLGATCRLVAITGYGDPGSRARSREAGFAAHLVKPVTVDLIVRAIIDDL